MIEMKESVQKIQPYSINNKQYKIKLDANENSNYLIDDFFNLNISNLNFYPDSDATILRNKMEKYYNCKSENIIVGNGSSEIINMLINAYCDTDENILTFFPCFSMYEVYCKLCKANIKYVNTDKDFTQDIDTLIEKANILKPKIILLCNPNNPTGFSNSLEDIEKLLINITDSLVIVDEAYGDFMNYSSVSLINKYDNLIVTRTMSKAFGIAGIRVGCGISNKKLIENLWKAKIPYNLNSISQQIAIHAFDNADKVKLNINNIKNVRDKTAIELSNINFKTYNSSANFLFIKSPIENLDKKLEAYGVLIKAYNEKLKGYYRITIVDEFQSKILLDVLKEIRKNETK